MSTANNNAALKIDRAHRLGWSPSLRIGIGRFLRSPRAERRQMRANSRRLRINGAI
jgi:hypothetical protein